MARYGDYRTKFVKVDGEDKAAFRNEFGFPFMSLRCKYGIDTDADFHCAVRGLVPKFNTTTITDMNHGHRFLTPNYFDDVIKALSLSVKESIRKRFVHEAGELYACRLMGARHNCRYRDDLTPS